MLSAVIVSKFGNKWTDPFCTKYMRLPPGVTAMFSNCEMLKGMYVDSSGTNAARQMWLRWRFGW
jgi:hypothetical protein